MGMRSDVLQVVAIACQANLYLQGREERTPELLGHHNTFAQVHELLFDRGVVGNNRVVIADATSPWLRRLANEDVTRITLNLSACPIDANTNPQAPWGLVTDGDVGVEVWQPSWTKRIRTYSDPAPWRVLYSASRIMRNTENPVTVLAYAAKDLGEFCRAHRIQEFASDHLIPDPFHSEFRRVAETALGAMKHARECDTPNVELWRAAIKVLEAVLNVEFASWEQTMGQDQKRPA